MPVALPAIGAGLGIYSAIKGAKQQGEANRMTREQLAQQNQIRQLVLGRLMGGPQGAVGNPFSAAYGPPAPSGASAVAGTSPTVANSPRTGLQELPWMRTMYGKLQAGK